MDDQKLIDALHAIVLAITNLADNRPDMQMQIARLRTRLSVLRELYGAPPAIYLRSQDGGLERYVSPQHDHTPPDAPDPPKAA